MRIRGEIVERPEGKCAMCGKPLKLHQKMIITISGFDVLGGVVSRMQHVPMCPKGKDAEK